MGARNRVSARGTYGRHLVNMVKQFVSAVMQAVIFCIFFSSG